tara:strand:+ start:151 stop:339 length:189 start_codon:yes stop_codon:yes gene_type:complete
LAFLFRVLFIFLGQLVDLRLLLGGQLNRVEGVKISTKIREVVMWNVSVDDDDDVGVAGEQLT